MEKNPEFPKSTKEFYDGLIARNKLNAVKITKEAVEKLYVFLLEFKESKYSKEISKNIKEILISIEEDNDKNNDERKGSRQIHGECPNCKNILTCTGGLSQNRRGSRHGRYCLNCGKIYLKENLIRNVFTEDETPLFYRSNLKY